MVEKKRIPVAKGSAIENMKDVYNAKIIAWGAFKSKFHKYYKKSAGTKIVNGKEVYSVMKIDGNTNNKDSNVYKFLKHIGMSKEDLSSMYYDTWKADGVKHILLDWKKKPTFTEEDWVETINELKKETSDIKKLRIVQRTIAYPDFTDKTEAERISYPIKDTYGKINNNYVSGSDEWNTGQYYKLEAKQLYGNVDIYLLDQNEADITSDFTSEVIEAIKSLYFTSQEDVFTLESFSKLRETNGSTLEGDSLFVIEAEEIGSFEISSDFRENNYDEYSDYTTFYNNTDENGEYTQGFKYKDRYNIGIWKYRDQTITKNDRDKLFEEKDGTVYMVVKKFKRMKMIQYGQVMSNNLNIHIQQDSGNTVLDHFVSFFQTLMGALVELFKLAYDVMMYIPFFRLSVEAIVWTLQRTTGMSYSQATETTRNVLTTVGASLFFTVAITFLTGGTQAVNALATSYLELISVIASTANSTQKEVNEREQENVRKNKEELKKKRDALDEARRKQEERTRQRKEGANIGVTDFEKLNYELYEKLFNLDKAIDESIISHFDKDDEFNKDIVTNK